jgi:hypothetical protein
MATLSDFDVLRMLGGSGYLRAIPPDELRALARLSVSAHTATYNVGLMLAGLRSTTFCYLWLKSALVPRALAARGVLASVLMGVAAFLFVIFPELSNTVPVAIYGGPIFLFELAMGVWLATRSLRVA